MTLVCNAGPIIALAKIDRLSLLQFQLLSFPPPPV